MGDRRWGLKRMWSSNYFWFGVGIFLYFYFSEINVGDASTNEDEKKIA